MADPLLQDTGLIKIHWVCAKMGAVWRPTPSHDLGIDGQIEFLRPGSCESTGDILAVQCKSGRSYFSTQDDNYVYFYPNLRHRRYWKNLRLPVVLVLHNPDNDVTLYASVKPQLTEGGPMKVGRTNHFVPDCRDALLLISQNEASYFDPSKLLSKLTAIRRERGPDQIITGVDFLLASTNREQSYFELRMCRVTALFELLATGWVSIGRPDYEFILRNVLEISGDRLTEDFLDEFNRVWFELEYVPDIIAPLTGRGVGLLQHLWNNLDQFLSVQPYKGMGALSPLELAERISGVAQNASDRLDR